MKFYIGATIFRIPDNERARDIKTCCDNNFKTEIKISEEDFEYYFYTGRGDLFLNSIEDGIVESISTVIEQITEEIKSELRSKLRGSALD
jgi:hypothetical protein